MALDPRIVLSGIRPKSRAADRDAPFRRQLLEQEIGLNEQSLATGERTAAQNLQEAPFQQQLLEQEVATGQREAAKDEETQMLIAAQRGVNAGKVGDRNGVIASIQATTPQAEWAQEIAEYDADPDQYIATKEADINAFKSQTAKTGLASAKTEIFDNGTIITQLPNNTSQVTNPEGKVVTGAERVKVLEKAREDEIAFVGKKAKSRELGKLDPEASKLAAEKAARLAFTKSEAKFNDTISNTVSSIGSAKATHELMTDTVNEIKSFISGLNAVYGASLKDIPGTEAKKLKGLLDTMKANSAFGSLLDLKASGGTLGAISTAELELLAAKLGSIDQKGEIPEMLRVLDQILDQNLGSIDRMETSFASEKARFARGFDEPEPATQQEIQKQPAAKPQQVPDVQTILGVEVRRIK